MRPRFPFPFVRALLALGACASSASATVATDLCPPTADPCIVNTALTIDPGSIIDLGGRALQFGSAARVAVGVGTVSISAGPVRLLPGARITGGAGVGGTNFEIVSSGSISLEGSGSTKSRIDVSAEAIAGAVTLHATTGITISGDIVSDGRDQDADGGLIVLDTAAGDVGVTGALSVKGGSLSGGGSIFVSAGGNIDLAQIIDVSGGDFGGGEVDAAAGGNVIVRQDVLAGGGGFSGDGGSLSIDAGGTATILGTFKGPAAGDSEDGGGTGGDVEINADNDVVVSGQMQLTGGFPDGEGGTFFVQSGGSFTHTAAIQLLGNGIDGCGGSMDVSAARDVTLARIEVSGGSCGAGDVTVQALGTVTVGGLISGDSTVGLGSGGVISLQGRDVITNEVIRANGGSMGLGGSDRPAGLQRDGQPAERDPDQRRRRRRQHRAGERPGHHPRQAPDRGRGGQRRPVSRSGAAADHHRRGDAGHRAGAQPGPATVPGRDRGVRGRDARYRRAVRRWEQHVVRRLQRQLPHRELRQRPRRVR